MTAPPAPAPFSEETFEAHRPLLFGVAYRMLGSAVEAEDMVQETYLRAANSDEQSLRNPAGYLVTIVTRLCMDQLKSARRQRETYIGPWLPEPLPTAQLALPPAPEARVTAEESISLAFLVLLESLGPLERAVFLLRDVFDYSYDEVATMVGRTSPGCRQIVHRARQRIEKRRPRYHPSKREREEITLRFLHAAGTGDMHALLALLASDVTAWSDGGGKVAAAVNPVVGAERVAKFILGVTAKLPPTAAEIVELNGQPAMRATFRGKVHSLLQLELNEAGQVSAIHIIRNPDKMRRFAPA